MKVFLGDMELRQSEKPDSVPLGGGQHIVRREFPGGNTAFQFFGSKYRSIEWNGWFEGQDAYSRMIAIGNMRQKGTPVVFKTEMFENEVVIEEYLPEHRTNTFIPFSIKLGIIIGPSKKDENKDAVDKISDEIAEQLAQSETVKTEIYTVVYGDTLSKIAARFYGNPNEYGRIYEANRDVLKKGPHLIYSGQRLVIPK